MNKNNSINNNIFVVVFVITVIIHNITIITNIITLITNITIHEFAFNLTFHRNMFRHFNVCNNLEDMSNCNGL